MAYWWVNQKQSYRQDRAGGFMWAPLGDAAGHALGPWEAMALVERGDIVFHYADGAVRAVSRVTHRAEIMPRPDDPPDNRGRDGRLVRVAMTDLMPPIPLAALPLEDRLTQLGGPFNVKGGVKRAYLFAISEPFGSALLERFGRTVGFTDPVLLEAIEPDAVRKPISGVRDDWGRPGARMEMQTVSTSPRRPDQWIYCISALAEVVDRLPLFFRIVEERDLIRVALDLPTGAFEVIWITAAGGDHVAASVSPDLYRPPRLPHRERLTQAMTRVASGLNRLPRVADRERVAQAITGLSSGLQWAASRGCAEQANEILWALTEFRGAMLSRSR